jgi:hypothetical protein
MRIRVVLMLTALGLVAGITSSAEQVPLLATGTVVKKTADQLVVRTHDHGHLITSTWRRTRSCPTTSRSESTSRSTTTRTAQPARPRTRSS